MVLLLLEIKAELESITNLVPKGGSDGSEYTFFFKIKCGGCGTVSDKETSVTPSELYDLPKSKGSANLVQKVRFFSCLRVQPSMGSCRDETLVVQEVLHCDACRRGGVSEGFAADAVLCLLDFWLWRELC